MFFSGFHRDRLTGNPRSKNPVTQIARQSSLEVDMLLAILLVALVVVVVVVVL